MNKQQEMNKLWSEMQTVEQTQPPAGADQAGREAFFLSKKKEMAKLQDAYKKLSGLSGDPHNTEEKEAIGRKRLLGGIGTDGLKPGEHPTADKL